VNSKLNISSILRDAQVVSHELGLKLRIVDVTANAASLRLYFDDDLFIQIYANQPKSKLNLSLVFKNQRLLGADSEGNRYHLHPGTMPESHIFTEEQESLKSFTFKALKVLSEKGLL
jgi:hypothetical protein